ncbi:immunoglobulin-like domain-containing protein, partial [Pseudomonas sp. CAM1A]|uniref:immunoglobulin-like domain-containing protein n=1 Tax=Pseudomonas sp. CAM1A TaxID=3231717 RepID=UPI0039C6F034
GTGTPGTDNQGDKVTVTIVGKGDVTEDQQPAFTVKVSQKLDHDLTVTLSNGDKVSSAKVMSPRTSSLPSPSRSARNWTMT